MANLLIVAQQVAVLFLLIGVGALLRRTKLLDGAAVGGMVNVLLLVVTPCLILDVFQRPFAPSMLAGLAIAFGLATAAHVAVILLARLFVRAPNDDARRPLLLAAVFSNAGFMGLPLEQALLGADGVFYGIVYVAVFNLFIWSWGVRTMSGVPSWNAKIFINPGTVGLALGLPFFFLSVRLPAVVAEPVHQLANLNTPLAMLVIGHYLASVRLTRVLRMPGLFVASFLRLVGCPLLMIVALYPFRRSLDRNMILALVVAASAPVAAMVSMFAARFRRDVDVAAAVMSGTTLLSILTMPAVIAWAMNLL